MNTYQLKTFLAVVSEGSFSRAARVVHVSQSTVSLHIRELEDGLGVRLLDRGRSGVAATSSGRVLLLYADRLIGLEQEAIAQVRAVARAPAGRLAITASTVPGEYHLPELLARFNQAHPYVSVELKVATTETALADLRGGDCELAFIGAACDDPEVISRPFAHDEIVLVGAPDLAPPRADAFRYVARGEGSATRAAVIRLLPPGAEVALVAGTNEAVRRCALAGAGVAFLSRAAIVEDVKTGRLREFPWPGTPLHRELHVARLARMPVSSAAEALLTTLGVEL